MVALEQERLEDALHLAVARLELMIDAYERIRHQGERGELQAAIDAIVQARWALADLVTAAERWRDEWSGGH